MNPSYGFRLLRCGNFRLDGGGMFGLIPKSLWRLAIEPDEDNRIPLTTNALLLEREDAGEKPTRILIECGYGDKWTDKERAIYDLERRTVVDALHDIDVEPESIAHVIVTHLHFDHAGGLTRSAKSVADDHTRDRNAAGRSAGTAPATDTLVPTFPNAEIIVQRQEWDDALANRSTMSRTYLRTHLDPIADRVRLIDGAAEVLPGIDVDPMPGHTWGQQSVRFRDAQGIVCFPGDVIPTIHHAGLPYNMAYDMLPYQNMLSKRALLTRAAEENWRLVLDHEPDNPIVRVVREGEGPKTRWALVPVGQDG